MVGGILSLVECLEGGLGVWFYRGKSACGFVKQEVVYFDKVVGDSSRLVVGLRIEVDVLYRSELYREKLCIDVIEILYF